MRRRRKEWAYLPKVTRARIFYSRHSFCHFPNNTVPSHLAPRVSRVETYSMDYIETYVFASDSPGFSRHRKAVAYFIRNECKLAHVERNILEMITLFSFPHGVTDHSYECFSSSFCTAKEGGEKGGRECHFVVISRTIRTYSHDSNGPYS